MKWFSILLYLTSLIYYTVGVSLPLSQMYHGCYKVSLRPYGLKFNFFMIYMGTGSLNFRVVPDDREVSKRRVDAQTNVCSFVLPDSAMWIKLTPNTAPEIMKKSMSYMSIHEMYLLGPLEQEFDKPMIDFITPWSISRNPTFMTRVIREEDDFWGDCFFDCSKTEAASYKPTLPRDNHDVFHSDDPRFNPNDVVAGNRDAAGKFMRDILRDIQQKNNQNIEEKNAFAHQFNDENPRADPVPRTRSGSNMQSSSRKFDESLFINQIDPASKFKPNTNNEKEQFNSFTLLEELKKQSLSSNRGGVMNEDEMAVVEYYLQQLPMMEELELKSWKEKMSLKKFQKGNRNNFKGGVTLDDFIDDEDEDSDDIEAASNTKRFTQKEHKSQMIPRDEF